MLGVVVMKLHSLGDNRLKAHPCLLLFVVGPRYDAMKWIMVMANKMSSSQGYEISQPAFYITPSSYVF